MTIAMIILVLAALATYGYIVNLHNRIDSLATINDQWLAYSDNLESERDSWIAYADALKAELRKYTPIIVDYKIAKNQVSAHKVATSGYNGKAESTYALTLPLMPELPSDTKLELAPMVMDDNGKVIDNGGMLRAVKIAPIVDSSKATNSSNGKASNKPKNTDSSKVDNSKAIASDSGSFSSNEPDYEALAAKYKDSSKYNELLGKVRKIANGKLTPNQINYLLSKFDQWENKPNTIDEYAKRITSDHLAKNK